MEESKDGIEYLKELRVGRVLIGLVPNEVMTSEEHYGYVHICGRTGKEIDEGRICIKCDLDQKEVCLKDHAILGTDW